MAKSRRSSNTQPTMWVTDYEINRRGDVIMSHDDCLWRNAWLNRRTADEEVDHVCSRCMERGHNCTSCPYPVIYKRNPFARRRRIRRCSRCGVVGHNVRTCVFPV